MVKCKSALRVANTMAKDVFNACSNEIFKRIEIDMPTWKWTKMPASVYSSGA